MTYFMRIAILTGACMIPIIAIFSYALYKRIKATKNEERVDRIINSALTESYEDRTKVNLEEKLLHFWSRHLKVSGLVSPISNDRRNLFI